MAGSTIYLSILTLKVNGLNSLIKRQHLTHWIKKEDLTICCLQETHLIDRNKHWLRVKGWKNIYQANGIQNQARVTILISDKVDFKLILVKRDKEGHFILIKDAMHQKEITIINLYAPNVSVHNFIKNTLKDLKAQIDSNTVVVGDFNTPLSPIDRSSTQKYQQRNPRRFQVDLTDVYRILHPTKAQYTFFLAAHGTFFKIYHVLGTKQASANIKK
jgi:exonuclease III